MRKKLCIILVVLSLFLICSCNNKNKGNVDNSSLTVTNESETNLNEISSTVMTNSTAEKTSQDVTTEYIGKDISAATSKPVEPYKPNEGKIGKCYNNYGKEISWDALAEGSECIYYDENGIEHQFRKLLKNNWYIDPDYCPNCGTYLRGTGFFSTQTCTSCNISFTRSNYENYRHYCGDCGKPITEQGCYNLTVCQTCGEIYKSHSSHACLHNRPIQ